MSVHVVTLVYLLHRERERERERGGGGGGEREEERERERERERWFRVSAEGRESFTKNFVISVFARHLTHK